MANLGLVLAIQSALTLSPGGIGPVKDGPVNDICMKAQMVSQTNPPITNQLLVQFDDNLSDAAIDEIVKRLGSTVIDRLVGGKLLVVEVPYPETLVQIESAFEATPGVKYAEPNQVYKTQPDNTGTVEPGVIKLPEVGN